MLHCLRGDGRPAVSYKRHQRQARAQSANSSRRQLLTDNMDAEASIPPEAMMHFPPLSHFPPISEEIFRLRGNFSQFHFLPKNRFSSSKMFDDFFRFFSHRLYFSNFPLFSLYFPLFRKFFYSPYYPSH